MEKSRNYLDSLNDTEEDNDNLIENLEMAMDNLEMKWQLFLALKHNIDEADEVISADETGPDVKKEVGPDDLIVEVPTITLSWTELPLTKVRKLSVADADKLTVKPGVESLEGDPAEVSPSPHGTGIKAGSAGGAEQMEGCFIAQMRCLIKTRKIWTALQN